jgi:twinkle protein
MTDAATVKRELQLRVSDLCLTLLPGGRKRGHEYRCGSIRGGAGESFAVHLSGSKAGMWGEFNGEDGAQSGDVLALVQAARNCSFVEALDWARDFCGMARPAFHPIAKRTYVRPERPRCRRPAPESRAGAYLASRGLRSDVIAAYQVADGEMRGGAPAMVFPFKRAGELVMVKWIGLERPEGKKVVATTADSEPCLFGWHAIPDSARAVVIAEGEIDAMTWWQMGYPALSPPRGTADSSWVDVEYPALDRFETVYLAYDADEAGRKAAAKLAPRFGERARIVGAMPTGKDANEWMLAGAGPEDFGELLRGARDLRPDELKSPLEYEAEVIEEFYPTSQTVVGFEPPFAKMAGRVHFRPSEVSIWTGYNHHGKTEMLNYLMVVAGYQGERACLASLEVPARKTLRRLVRQASGEQYPSPERIKHVLGWLAEHFWLYDCVATVKLERILEVFGYARRRYGVSQFVVDNLARLGVGEDDYDAQKGVMNRLLDFTQATGAHVHMVAHPRKGHDETEPPGKLDVRGGGVLTDLAHNVFAVWRNVSKHERLAELEAKNDPGNEIPELAQSEPDAIWAVRKQRETGETPMVRLWWHRGSLQFHEEAWAPALRFCDVPAPLRDVRERAEDEPEFVQYEDEGPLPF